MARVLEYRSAGIELFDAWLNTLVIFLGVTGLLWYFDFSFISIFLCSFATMVLLLAYGIVKSISKITKFGDVLTLVDQDKRIEFCSIDSIETWWSYESIEAGGENTLFNIGGLLGSNKNKGLTNKINIFLKIESKGKYVLLREQIHMSSKFPNNHPYKVAEEVDSGRLFKVWDLDNCIEKLKLSEFLDRAIK